MEIKQHIHDELTDQRGKQNTKQNRNLEVVAINRCHVSVANKRLVLFLIKNSTSLGDWPENNHPDEGSCGLPKNEVVLLIIMPLENEPSWASAG